MVFPVVFVHERSVRFRGRTTSPNDVDEARSSLSLSVEYPEADEVLPMSA